jgi:hypothetical protein
MPEKPDSPITITLSPAQVDSVVRAASRGRAPSISTLIADSLAAPLRARHGDTGNGNGNGGGGGGETESSARRGYLPSESSDPRMSRCCAGSRCSPASGLTAARAASSNSRKSSG